MSAKKVVKPKTAKSKKNFRDLFYEKYAPILTGIGASVVIIGALFKIQHWPGGGPILTIGLGTEALLFLMFAFAPQHKDPEWSRVYPQLADDYDGPLAVQKSNGEPLDAKLAKIGGVDDDVIKRLGDSFRGLNTNVAKLSTIGDAAGATNEYAQNARAAAKSLTEMNKSYGTTVEALSVMTSAAGDAKAYHAQVQGVTKNLGALNAVYEMELQDAQNHVKALNKFYGSVATAMEQVEGAGKDAQEFKAEMGKLNNNIQSLNTVYGNMLTAMRG
ncbi:MAG: gliding motility protein GldL [Catalinimonas sp.]